MEKIHKCKECSKIFKYKRSLIFHTKTVHSENRPFKCIYCSKTFKTKGSLKEHKNNIHEKENEKCYFPNCNYEGKHLRAHLRTHNKEKKYNCEICNEKFTTVNLLNKHKKNNHPKIIKCKFCDYKVFELKRLKRHVNTIHSTNKPYKCNFENCDYKTNRKDQLKKHFNKIHTKEGQARQKKQEHRIKLLLDKNNIIYTREERIDFSCFDSGRSCSYIDFVIQRKNCIILLEVDEDQHKFGNYSINCDMKRMSHIITAIRCQGNELPILFVRYNPNTYRLNGELQKILKRDREQQLIEYLKNYKSIGDNKVEIKYMYYDEETYNNRTIPIVILNSDYDMEMKKCVVFNSSNFSTKAVLEYYEP